MAKKVLVADDDPGILDGIKQILELEGYEVITIIDGETAKKVREETPDLVLLDIWMSGIDGRNICKSLKSQKATKNIPIIILSAHMSAKDIAKEAGADDFLAKPFEMDELIDRVAKFIGTANS